MKTVPHVIPYQGSKRKLAETILSYMEFAIETLYEPFVGSGAITLATAVEGKAKGFVIGDKLDALAELWKIIVENPDKLAEDYSHLWNSQLEDPAKYFLKVRGEFNETKEPAKLLYLIARCVKNSIRFNNKGEFNQGADHRRLGLKPEKVHREAKLISNLLKNRVKICSGDFRQVIASATKNDLIYMDPPYQGTSGKKDPRYAFLLDLDELITELDHLNSREIPYILSFDGTCGDKSYGADLPSFLNLEKVSVNAGRSSQAILLGRDDVTIESLYLAPALLAKKKPIKKKRMIKKEMQLTLLD